MTVAAKTDGVDMGLSLLYISRPTSMDLDTAMQESRTAVHLFFNNKFDEAWELLRPWLVTPA
ncbi:hypothetical protein J6590_043278 [Homalodisca vitripennis]|nr:hypothetical protein J6590_043278 [Homalodisca vitripennis]